MTVKPFCSKLAAAMVTIAAVFAIQPARAATPPHNGIQADLGNPSLVVRLNADGSLVVSQSDKAGVAPITLPSIQALPAQIDASVSPPRQKKKLAVTAEPATSYRNFIILMNQAKKAGFGKVVVLGLVKSPCDGSSDLTIDILQDMPTLSGKPLFVSLGDDGNVILTLGLGDDAHGKSVSSAEAPGAAAGLVPKGRAKTQGYYRADLGVSFGNAVGLLRRLEAAGFCKLSLAGEAVE